MAMDKRVVAVLDAIVNDSGITGTKLEEQFCLTCKQLSYTLKKVNDYLESNHFDRINDYHILGEELEKRYLLLNCLRRVLEIPVAKNILAHYNNVMSDYLEKVGNVFSEIEKRFKIQFTDRQLQELIYFICFVLHRIDSGKGLVNIPSSYADIIDSREFTLMQSVISKININSENELVFLTALIQSSNIQSIADKYFHLDTLLLESVVAVVDNFEKISCVTIKEKNELIEKIYQHWKPAYYRIRYHLTNTSSVYDLVVKEFSHLHEMVRRAAVLFAEGFGFD